MIKVADWVTTKSGGNGIVQRVAKNGSWADVRWRSGTDEWTKRMPTESLIVKASIRVGQWTITDINREQELDKEASQ